MSATQIILIVALLFYFFIIFNCPNGFYKFFELRGAIDNVYKYTTYGMQSNELGGFIIFCIVKTSAVTVLI